jgi:nitrous oxide reductase accessory protein NosL
MVRTAKANLVWIAALGAVLLIFGTGLAATKDPVQPSKKDKCPVCGMFVYKYPDWLAEIIFKDESVDFFDGAKDLFKYYFNIRKYNPGKNKKGIADIYVMEYYDMKLIDARKAFFIMGSDIYGPMGHELIPFATEADAKAFMMDHKGKKILRFEAITPRVIDNLD